MTGLAVLALFATTAMLTAEESHPLDCKCEPGESSSGAQGHYYPVDGSGSRAYTCTGGECHISLFSGTCSGNHSGCGGNLTAVDATEAGDGVRPSVVNLAARVDVVYNAERRALQVIGCNGVLTGHIAISHAERDAVMGVRLALAL